MMGRGTRATKWDVSSWQKHYGWQPCVCLRWRIILISWYFKMAEGATGTPSMNEAVTVKDWLSLCYRCLIYGSYTILIHLCEVDGKLPFSSASTVFLTEVLKVTEFFSKHFVRITICCRFLQHKQHEEYRKHCRLLHGGGLLHTIWINGCSTLVDTYKWDRKLSGSGHVRG